LCNDFLFSEKEFPGLSAESIRHLPFSYSSEDQETSSSSNDDKATELVLPDLVSNQFMPEVSLSIASSTPIDNHRSLINDDEISSSSSSFDPKVTFKIPPKGNSRKRNNTEVADTDSSTESVLPDVVLVAETGDEHSSVKKKQVRLERNRKSAHDCRERKKRYVEGLEKCVSDLTFNYKKLAKEFLTLKEESRQLRQQLQLAQQSGFHVNPQVVARTKKAKLENNSTELSEGDGRQQMPLPSYQSMSFLHPQYWMDIFSSQRQQQQQPQQQGVNVAGPKMVLFVALFCVALFLTTTTAATQAALDEKFILDSTTAVGAVDGNPQNFEHHRIGRVLLEHLSSLSSSSMANGVDSNNQNNIAMSSGNLTNGLVKDHQDKQTTLKLFEVLEKFRQEQQTVENQQGNLEDLTDHLATIGSSRLLLSETIGKLRIRYHEDTEMFSFIFPESTRSSDEKVEIGKVGTRKSKDVSVEGVGTKKRKLIQPNSDGHNKNQEHHNNVIAVSKNLLRDVCSNLLLEQQHLGVIM